MQWASSEVRNKRRGGDRLDTRWRAWRRSRANISSPGRGALTRQNDYSHPFILFSVDPADSFNDKAGTPASDVRRVSEVLPSRVAVRSFVSNLAAWARHLLRSGPHHPPRGWLHPMAGTGFKPTCRKTTGEADVTCIIHHVSTRVGSYATPANRVTPEPLVFEVSTIGTESPTEIIRTDVAGAHSVTDDGGPTRPTEARF